MNAEHLRAFLWLRWRIRVNQLKRGGTANAVILGVLAGLAILAGLGACVGLFLIGLWALPGASPLALLLLWDGLVFGFLFFWLLGLLMDLQRSEALSLDKFLHLPVSGAGAFLINYLSSLPGLSLILFLPAMTGLSLGLVCADGPALLLLLPLVTAFFLMVTALTYQFQGWLAALMANPRRRRTILVVVTVGFVLLFQLPNLLMNYFRPWEGSGAKALAARVAKKQAQLKGALSSGKITRADYEKRTLELMKEYQAQTAALNQQNLQKAEQTAQLVNLVLPPGWLALGAAALAEGDVPVTLLATLGLALIGTASLYRAYRTTLRLYTGQFNTVSRKSAAAVAPASPRPRRTPLLERNLPGLSEQTAAIALSGFRSLLRAPEAKMMLLSPIILVVVFGSMIVTQPMDPPENLRPLLASGAMAMAVLNLLQLAGNQFGFDRGGFRVFILCPAPRRDILVGKNLALAPLVLTLGMALLVLFEVVYPMRIDHLLAGLPQLLSMYLLACLVANWLSILAPMRIRQGALKPAQPSGTAFLIHFLFFFVFILALAPTLLPWGVEWLLEERGLVMRAPICLILSLLECVGAVYLYRFVVDWQGDLLQAREQRIALVVTTQAE